MTEAKRETTPWLPADTKLECPVGPPVQLWIESSIRWFRTEFGPEPLLRTIVLPRDLPQSSAASAEQIGMLVDRACEQMSVDRSGVRLEVFDGSAEKRKAERSGRKRMVGHFRMEGGRPVIAIDLAESADSAYVMAIIAHELSHVRLLGEARIESTRPDQERLTDLLTVYFGFGALTANGAFSYETGGRSWSVDARGSLDERTLNAARNDGYRRLGYLNEREFGYALACYGKLRSESHPAWAGYLNPRARAALRQGLAYLAAAGPGQGLPTERVVDTAIKRGKVTVTVIPRAVGSSSPSTFVLPAMSSAPGIRSGGMQPGHSGKPQPGSTRNGRRAGKGRKRG